MFRVLVVFRHKVLWDSVNPGDGSGLWTLDGHTRRGLTLGIVDS